MTSSVSKAGGITNPLTAVGSLMPVSAEFIVPSSVVTYSANFVVSNNATTTTLLQLPGLFRVAGSSGYIVALRVATNLKSITPRFRLHFFNVSNPTFSGDNSLYKELYADSSKRCGYWDMPALNTASDTTNTDCSRSVDVTCRIPVIAAAGSSDLYVGFETLDAFTRASAQRITLTAFLDSN